MIPRDLVDKFLAMYLPMVASLRCGHPLAAAADEDPLPDLDFGPLISATKVAELNEKVDEALRWGAVPIYRGTLDPARSSRVRTLRRTTRRSRCSHLPEQAG